jgi:hypothetical protein
MKISLRSTSIGLWILAGVVVIMTAVALTIPISPAQNSPTAGAMVGTVSSPPQPDTEVGSTDGIVMLAALIALIITVPIILRWRDWIRNNNKPASPDHHEDPL